MGNHAITTGARAHHSACFFRFSNLKRAASKVFFAHVTTFKEAIMQLLTVESIDLVSRSGDFITS